MELRTVDEKITPELRKGDVVVIEWRGDIVRKTNAYICVKAQTTARTNRARVVLQNLNGLGKAFLKPNEQSIMADLERLREKGDLTYKHYSQDDYMMVAIEKKKEGAR